MKTKQYTITLGAAVFAAALLINPALAKEAAAEKIVHRCKAPSTQTQAKVQIAILLDTSGSMSGLIEQAKTQLWKIVNTFNDAKQNGEVPYVEVALYEYGKSSLCQQTHWIRCIQPLTRDLDEISKQLFSLRTNGGEEYCGAVIQRATQDLKWDPSNRVYKAIFIAGNEAFSQGPVNAVESVRSAIGKGVIVNTIHCGNEQAGISGGWKNGAMLADGKFLTIDHNCTVVHIEAPQDADIVKLNKELNKTYLAYGDKGASKKLEQERQDDNAEAKSPSGAHVQRAITKGSINYSNTTWDLVDASKNQKFDITKLKDKDLPKEMQGMTPAKRKAYIAEKTKERVAIQEKIQQLNKQRKLYVGEKHKERAENAGVKTLDEAVANTVRAQAEKKGYAFKE